MKDAANARLVSLSAVLEGMRISALFVCISSTLLMAQSSKHTPDLNELKRMSVRFAPTPLEVDTSKLSAGDQKALVKLVEAARVIDDLFLTQYWSGNHKLHEQLKKDIKPIGSKLIYLSDFIYKMDLAYAAADIIVSRAGAISVSEVCLVAKPVILVPSPNVAEDHQTKNAMALVTKNAAILVKDVEAESILVDQTLQLLKNQNQCNELSENIKKLGIADAPDRILKEIEKLVKS